jgi:hypothetical protein
MAVRQPRYSKEEFAQRGDLIYQTQIRPQVEADNHGKIVAIDIETGTFDIYDAVAIWDGPVIQTISCYPAYRDHIQKVSCYHLGNIRKVSE